MVRAYQQIACLKPHQAKHLLAVLDIFDIACHFTDNNYGNSLGPLKQKIRAGRGLLWDYVLLHRHIPPVISWLMHRIGHFGLHPGSLYEISYKGSTVAVLRTSFV